MSFSYLNILIVFELEYFKTYVNLIRHAAPVNLHLEFERFHLDFAKKVELDRLESPHTAETFPEYSIYNSERIKYLNESLQLLDKTGNALYLPVTFLLLLIVSLRYRCVN